MPILDNLKAFDVNAASISLWVFKGPYGSSDAPPIYTGYWVQTSDSVDAALRETVNAERNRLGETIEYGLLAQNNEESALLIAKDETNADLLVEIVAAETAAKRAQSVKRLQNASFYLIKLTHNDVILYAVRRTKSAWKTKHAITACSIFFAENGLDLDNRPHFDLENTIDFFVFGEELLILHKVHFESTLRYKEAHVDDFLTLQGEPDFAYGFTDLAPLVQHVGVNKIRLRRMSAIRQKGHYRDAAFMERLRQHHAEYGFTLHFDADGKIVLTAETSSQIITALLDHRLASGFSQHVYDVPSTVPVQV